MTFRNRSSALLWSSVLAALALPSAALAQDHPMSMPGIGMPGMQMPAAPQSAPATPKPDMPGMTMPASSPPDAPARSDAMADMPGMKTDGMKADATKTGGMAMNGMMAGQAGGYSMMRDASGTSWQPDSTPMQGLMGEWAGWSTMLHGFISGVYDHQAGPRGDDKSFSESMFMAMGQKQLGIGTLTLRSMLSLDPFMGKSGYPLLLQTGETANGFTPLVDRQHPHDLFMELAGIYSVPVGADMSVFGYVGYPGEPALGPPTFMHRFSGMDDPAAPISHHWLDSTHITYGVVTAGFVDGNWKIEGSAFRGREPDQFRWNFDPVSLDSASARLSWNPTSDWALQVSYGFIKSPEQLEPDVDQHRLTASASYNVPLDHGNWQTTLAWGRNNNQPGHALDAFLLESSASWYRHTLFFRGENAAKDELFQPPSPLAGQVFRVAAFSLGYVYDIPVAEHLGLGLGAMGTIDALPGTLTPAYGGASPTSYMLFTRLKIE